MAAVAVAGGRAHQKRWGPHGTACPADVFVVRAAVLESACREPGADGRITVYITGAGYITIGRIGWFVLALVVGFGWLALWETLILPDNPLRSLNLSVQAFSHRAATPSPMLSTPEHGPGQHAVRSCPKSPAQDLDRARKCRSAIETQFPGAVVRRFSQNDVDQLRVALH